MNKDWVKRILPEERFTFLCEIIFWLNPQKSLIYLSLFNIFVLSFYAFFKNGLIALGAYYFLFKLWYPIWNDKIWPNIQTPIVGVLADWTTLDPAIPDYEISIDLI